MFLLLSVNNVPLLQTFQGESASFIFGHLNQRHPAETTDAKCGNNVQII